MSQTKHPCIPPTWRFTSPIVAIALASCSATPKGTLLITTGGETDTFSRAPVPTKLYVDAVDATGQTTRLTTAKLPADTVDLGDQNATNVVSLRVTAVDDQEHVLIEGTSVPVELGALGGIGLPVFVQRNGEFARLPSPFSDARDTPLTATIIGRYVLVAGGSDASKAAQSQLYDFGSLSPFDTPPVLPRAPHSLAALGTDVLLVDDTGATWFELADSSTMDAPAPTGGAFADVAGGSTIIGSDLSMWIIGGTRTTGSPTARVLRIDVSGTLSFVSLSAPRLGASATWVEGRGIVVVGGSATAPGAEILATDATSAVPLPFPPDATTGQGVCPLDGARVLLGGGLDPSGASSAPKVIDLGCATGCTATPWAPALAVSLSPSSLFALDGKTALFVGDDSSGLTHAFRLSPMGATEVPPKVARHHARVVPTYSGAFALVGGAPELEYFIP